VGFNILIDLQFLAVYANIMGMLAKNKKQAVIKKNQIHEKDTGSPEVQVAVLSSQIDALAKHLKKHKKDNHSRRGLIKMVADRRTHLKYLERKDKTRYNALMKKMDLA
jgi:small subunit ribosomal protein S15